MTVFYRFVSLIVLGMLAPTLCAAEKKAAPKLKALIINGQSNHKDWALTTQMMRNYLEETGLFSVSVATTPPKGGDMIKFLPDFKPYQLVIVHYNGDLWTTATRTAFEKYVAEGGGFLAIHAANNTFPKWKEYNKMIGLGGWQGRDERDGPMVYYNDSGQIVRDTSPRKAGHHGPRHPYVLTNRAPNHPITKGLPQTWSHVEDELPDSLRGPAENMTILVTGYSEAGPRAAGSNLGKYQGTLRHEPLAMALTYHKGRVAQLPMAHSAQQWLAVDNIVLFQRAAQWCATGKVTMILPPDFPTLGAARTRGEIPSSATLMQTTTPAIK